ncbi:MAG: AmmeMemoRadiSam system protein B [Phycisphaerales bacterium]|nr:AmmeMemoRadiSam system protein B [Phycisphaerales bacterium]
MPFSDLPEHLLMPALRQFQAWPIKHDDKPLVAIRDPFMLTNETLAIPPNIFAVIQRINGESTAQEIAKATKAQPEQFVDLLKKLDSLGLLWGPTATKLEIEAVKRLKEEGAFPVRSSGSLGKTTEDCKEQIESWFSEAEDPELEQTVRAIVAPHLDYARGWPNYASAYYPWKNAEKPNRVVILGTNHFGNGDGVVLSTIGFKTPLGTCPIDEKVVNALVDKFEDAITADFIDLSAEHSIELQLPWLQYCFGDIPVVAALIPNPLIDMIEDDAGRTSTKEFVDALEEILETIGGTTLFISSADLSHVGQQFGEPRPVDDQRKFDVERHDREMMSKYVENDAEEFVSAIKWNNNATQWCSIGNMSALLDLVKPDVIELIDYRQACDERGHALVSSCSMALI